MTAIGVTRATVLRLLPKGAAVTSGKVRKPCQNLLFLKRPNIIAQETMNCFRGFHTSRPSRHGDDGDLGPEVVEVTFIDKTGAETPVCDQIDAYLF